MRVSSDYLSKLLKDAGAGQERHDDEVGEDPSWLAWAGVAVH